MAFSIDRFSTFNAGQTGAGVVAKYDGSGTGTGADALATIKGNGYFGAARAGQTPAQRRASDPVRDAIRQSSDGRTTGSGLPIFLHANDGLEMDVAYLAAGDEIRLRGAAWNIT